VKSPRPAVSVEVGRIRKLKGARLLRRGGGPVSLKRKVGKRRENTPCTRSGRKGRVSIRKRNEISLSEKGKSRSTQGKGTSTSCTEKSTAIGPWGGRRAKEGGSRPQKGNSFHPMFAKQHVLKKTANALERTRSPTLEQERENSTQSTLLNSLRKWGGNLLKKRSRKGSIRSRKCISVFLGRTGDSELKKTLFTPRRRGKTWGAKSAPVGLVDDSSAKKKQVQGGGKRVQGCAVSGKKKMEYEPENRASISGKGRKGRHD